MKMLSKISWRNIWRNPLRSAIVITSIALGLWAGLFIMGFSMGMGEQRVNTAIKQEISHLQVHHPSYKDSVFAVDLFIPNPKSLQKKIEEIPGVKAASSRLEINAMANTSRGSQGISLFGVNPEDENAVTELSSRIDTGTYFKIDKRNPLVIGKALAKKLKIEVGDKMVISFQDVDNNITSGAYRISGLYSSVNSKYEERYVFAKINDLQRLINAPNACHEIAIMANSKDELNNIKAKIQAFDNNILVETWREISPEVRLIVDSFGQSMRIFIVIILLGLAFGIVNTMLMAVLERTRELGMLMAVGMTKRKVFSMVMIETLFIALIGGPIGLALGYLTIFITGESGIGLSFFSEGLSSYGMSSVVYPKLNGQYYLEVSIMVTLAALLSAIYPARKALKLNPSESIRKL